MCRWGARWLWAGWGPVASCGVAGLGAVGERVACVCLDPHGCRCGPHPPPARTLVAEALRVFFEVRDVPGLKKKPSTSELLDWLKLLMAEDIGPETLFEKDPKRLIPPLHGALLKNEQDVHLFERIAFMARREKR